MSDKLQFAATIRQARAVGHQSDPSPPIMVRVSANILTIHEIGEVDNVHFIATEFIDGITLRQRIQSASLNIREALDIAVQTASALTEVLSAEGAKDYTRILVSKRR